jgi:hypothetical protein
MDGETEVQEQTDSLRGVRPLETLTPGLAQSEDEDLLTPAIEFRISPSTTRKFSMRLASP